MMRCTRRAGVGMALLLAALHGPISAAAQVFSTGYSDDRAPVEFDLKGTLFRIPRTYLWVVSQWSGLNAERRPEDKTIFLRVALEDMRPFTRDRRALFEEPDRALHTVDIAIGHAASDQAPDIGRAPGYVISCSEGSMPDAYYACESRFRFLPSIFVTVTFDRSHLGRAPAIIEKTHEMITKFHLSGSGVSK